MPVVTGLLPATFGRASGPVARHIMIQPNSDHFSVWPSTTESSLPVGRTASAPTRELTPEQAELAAIVARAQAGDLDAQSDLVRRYGRRILGHVRGIIRNPNEAEDVSQTVFIKMIRRLGRLRDPSLFESWLFTLSRNTSLDYLRHCRRRPATVSADDELATFADTSTSHVELEIRNELDAALARLGAVDRTLILNYIHGQTYRTMAAQEGLTPGAVKARLHRVRPFLREFMSGVKSDVRDATRCKPAVLARCAA